MAKTWAAATGNRGEKNVKFHMSQECSSAMGSFNITSYELIRPPVREIFCSSVLISLTVADEVLAVYAPFNPRAMEMQENVEEGPPAFMCLEL